MICVLTLEPGSFIFASDHMKTFYITTPIYYVNDSPHIGHAYTTVAADVLARYRRLRGEEVFFLTGTDEYGRKIEQTATQNNETPKQLADRVVERFRSLWETLKIKNDDFIRTTEERHKRCAQKMFKTAVLNKDIYLGEYEGWYDVRAENFITETQMEEINKLPPEKRPKLEKIKEECFFFKLSSYQKRLLEHYDKNPGFVMPKERMNEVRHFVESGLKDLSISRTTFSWGVQVPENPDHVMYVWFDALSNYLTAAGFESDKNRFGKIWPADIHIVGKDIIRFHAVYWPAFLMSAGIELPKTIFAHGWWTVEGEKMSKSLGNAVNPVEITREFGVDAFRYFIMREIPFGKDGDFSRRVFISRINADLANGLGNLTSRALGMVERYFNATVPDSDGTECENSSIKKSAQLCAREIPIAMDSVAPGKALSALWNIIAETDKFVEKTKPWELHKKGEQKKLAAVLWTLCESLRIITVYSYPFMPDTAEKLWKKLGFKKSVEKSAATDISTDWGKMSHGQKVAKGKNLFNRIENAAQ